MFCGAAAVDDADADGAVVHHRGRSWLCRCVTIIDEALRQLGVTALMLPRTDQRQYIRQETTTG